MIFLRYKYVYRVNKFIILSIVLSVEMKIIVAGGDGFIGWPLCMRLSNLGHDVMIIDNLYRRKIDYENGYSSISPIKSIQDRLAKWK